MNFKFQISNFKKNRGMTLFIAVVVMSILLFISFVVATITIKGSLFATSGRDSQYAFYAADAGTECAFYWDSLFDKFATNTPGVSINCAGVINNGLSDGNAIFGTSTVARIGDGGETDPTSVFGFKLDQGDSPVPYCAIVTVYKYYEDINNDGVLDAPLKTQIKSRGYNTCDMTHPRRVERGIEITY